MRAAVEDELELVCGRLALRSVRDECVDLVEVYEDDLVRAAMDGEGIRLCSTLVGSCATAVQTAAVTRHTHAIRSEASRAEAPTGTDGHVSRLSGHTFEEAVLGRPGHVLLLLHHSEPAAVVAGVPEPVEAAYAEAWREFHKLASQLGGKVSEIGFATLDLRLNDGPALLTQPLPFQCCTERGTGRSLCSYLAAPTHRGRTRARRRSASQLSRRCSPRFLPRPGERSTAASCGSHLCTSM